MSIQLSILLLGDTNVGKTSLILSYVDNYFPDSHIATIGIDYKVKTIKKNGYNIKLQIWDTSGQERFRSLTNNILKGANGIVFVYDITNKKSFESIKTWSREAENYNSKFEGIIIGNKNDLDRSREVTTDMIKKYKSKTNTEMFEVSAKTGHNLNKAFDHLINIIIKDKTKEELLSNYGERTDSIRITKINNLSKSSKKECCKQ